jgi:hypothetical protein
MNVIQINRRLLVITVCVRRPLSFFDKMASE